MNTRSANTGAIPDIIDLAEFVDNPEPRCPCILVLDCSYSMSGSRIQALNDAVAAFKDRVCNDQVAAMRAEVAVIAFSHEINVVQDFVTVQDFNPPRLSANGGTRIAGAINASLDMLEARKETYKANGIEYFRPIAMLITDGYPEHDTDEEITDAGERIRRAEEQRAVAYFAFGMDGADMESLTRFMVQQRPPRELSVAQLMGVLQWLANSVSVISQSLPGMNIQLPSQDQYLSY